MVEISGEISADDFMSHYSGAIADISETLTIEGFRKGHAPENVILRHVSEESILAEMAERAIGSIYPTLLKKHSVDAIGRPQVTLTKLAKNNPLGFSIKTAVIPTVVLPDYRTLAKKAISPQSAVEIVTEEEIDSVLKELQRARAKDGVEPELTDDFVAQLGPFKTILELREKIKENLMLEKESRAKDKSRIAIVDAIRQETKIEIPEILIASEVEKMMAEMKASAAQMQMPFEHYLKHLNKTEEELKASWKPDAIKRVEAALILEAIAKKEELTVPEESLEHEVSHMKEHYPDADVNRLRNYIGGQLLNEEVFKLLEN